MSDKRYPHREAVIAVMGPIGAGKTSFINTIAGSATAIVRKSSEKSRVQVVRWVAADGHVLNLIDTPGFDDSHGGVTEIQVLQMISHFLSDEYNGVDKRLTGLIYFQPINTAQVSGLLRQNLHILQGLCGSQSLKNIVIVTSMWDLVDLVEGAKRELEFRSNETVFRPLIEAGAVMIRHNDDLTSALNIISYLRGKESGKTRIIDELFELLGKGERDRLTSEQAATQAKAAELERILMEERRKSEEERSRLERQQIILNDRIRVLSKKRENEKVDLEKAIQDVIGAKDMELQRILDEERGKVQAERAKLERKRYPINRPEPSNGRFNTTASYSDSEPMVVIMGPAGAGKSSFIKLVTESEEVKVEDKLESETNEVRVIRWVAKDGSVVNLVDTPGFGGMLGAEALRMIAQFLLDEYQDHKTHLSGIIYVHPISDARVTGSARRNLRMFTGLCGSQALQNVVILTSKWDMIDPAIGVRREKELASKETLFKPLIDSGAVMLRQDNGLQSATRVISHLRDRELVQTMIVDELLSGKTLAETSAAQVLNEEIQSLLKKSEDDTIALQKEMLDAVQKKDTALQRTLEEERKAREGDRARLERQQDLLRRG